MARKFNSKDQDLPPDPEGLNGRCAARAKAALELFCQLSGSWRDTAVRDLLHELMHLCDRDRELGAFDDELGWAYLFYDDCIEPYDDLPVK